MMIKIAKILTNINHKSFSQGLDEGVIEDDHGQEVRVWMAAPHLILSPISLQLEPRKKLSGTRFNYISN